MPCGAGAREEAEKGPQEADSEEGQPGLTWEQGGGLGDIWGQSHRSFGALRVYAHFCPFFLSHSLHVLLFGFLNYSLPAIIDLIFTFYLIRRAY